jgi:hypothetical protein
MGPTIVSRQEAVIVRPQVIDQVAVLELAAKSLTIDQVAARARVIVRGVELALAIGQTEAEQEHALVLVERELVRVEAVPERGPVAVPLRTKSVIAAHLRGFHPLLTAETDLAAAAATMREQAAAEAVTAWEAGEWAVVKAAAEEAVVPVADAGDKRKEL